MHIARLNTKKTWTSYTMIGHFLIGDTSLRYASIVDKFSEYPLLFQKNATFNEDDFLSRIFSLPIAHAS
jgi:hypothetical protein